MGVVLTVVTVSDNSSNWYNDKTTTDRRSDSSPDQVLEMLVLYPFVIRSLCFLLLILCKIAFSIENILFMSYLHGMCIDCMVSLLQYMSSGSHENCLQQSMHSVPFGMFPVLQDGLAKLLLYLFASQNEVDADLQQDGGKAKFITCCNYYMMD